MPLKCLKSDGSIRLFHKQNEKATVCLTLVFNSGLLHGFIPNEMLLGTLIPIPKKHKSLNESSNCRGITLCTILGKFYDFFLFRMNEALKSSNLQFGFYNTHSSSICKLVFKEISQYYIHKGMCTV